jgi:hypothetical protein
MSMVFKLHFNKWFFAICLMLVLTIIIVNGMWLFSIPEPVPADLWILYALNLVLYLLLVLRMPLTHYTLTENVLIVINWPFKTIIPYEKIYKIERFEVKWYYFGEFKRDQAGHGVKVHYYAGFWPSTKIFPDGSDLFLSELQSKAAQAEFIIRGK